MAWRSSTTAYLERYCPRALDHHEAGVPRDRDVFDVGIAAHAVLDVLCRRQRDLGRPLEDDEVRGLAQAAAEFLVRDGREFDGTPEPPMAPQHAAEGRDLAARAWYVYPAQIEDRSEHGLAVDAEWRPVDYASPRAWWKAAVDLVGPCVGDTGCDDGAVSGICVTDYKSAWPTDESELDTIQMRGQALVGVAHAERLGIAPAFVRRRVINLRTLQAFEADLMLDGDGEATLARWRDDIRLVVAAAEARGDDGRRPARPGIRCVGCPFATRCEAARAWLRGDLVAGTREDLATRFAVADGIRELLRKAAKLAAAEGPITIEGGQVGFVARSERCLTPDAVDKLCRVWWRGADPDALAVGLVTALQPSVTAVEHVAAVLHPRDRSRAAKEAREAFVGSITTTRTVARFDLHPLPTSKE